MCLIKTYKYGPQKGNYIMTDYSTFTDEEFKEELRKGIIEEEQGHKDIASLLLKDNYDSFTTPPAKIVGDFIKRVYNVSLLGVSREDNGENTLSFSAVLLPEDNRMLSIAKLRAADTLSIVSQKIGQRPYRFFHVEDKRTSNNYTIQFYQGKYYKFQQGEKVSSEIYNIADILK